MKLKESMKRVAGPIVVGVFTPLLLIAAVVIVHVIRMTAASTRAEKRGEYVETSTRRSCANFRRVPLGGVDEFDFGAESSMVDGVAAFRQFVRSNLQELRPAVFRNVLTDNEYLTRIRNDEELAEMLTANGVEVQAEGSLHEFEYRERNGKPEIMSAADYIARSKREKLYVVDSDFGWLIEGAGVSNTTSQFLRGFSGALREAVSHLWWSGSGGQQSVTHFDSHENFAVMLRGNKTFYVADHTHYDNVYYPYEAEDYGKQKSPIDFKHPEKYLSKYPRYNRSKWMKVVLTPGDMIYVPIGMLHHTEAPPNETSMMVNYFFQMPVWHGYIATKDTLVSDASKRSNDCSCPSADDVWPPLPPGRTSTFQHTFLTSSARWMTEGLRSLAFGIFTGAPLKFIVVGAHFCHGCHTDIVCYTMYALKERLDRILEEWLQEFSAAIWDRAALERPATTWGDAIALRDIDNSARSSLVSRVKSEALHCSAFPAADVALFGIVVLSGPVALLSVCDWKRRRRKHVEERGCID